MLKWLVHSCVIIYVWMISVLWLQAAERIQSRSLWSFLRGVVSLESSLLFFSSLSSSTIASISLKCLFCYLLLLLESLPINELLCYDLFSFPSSLSWSSSSYSEPSWSLSSSSSLPSLTSSMISSIISYSGGGTIGLSILCLRMALALAYAFSLSVKGGLFSASRSSSSLDLNES